jgi:hypothetical protein
MDRDIFQEQIARYRAQALDYRDMSPPRGTPHREGSSRPAHASWVNQTELALNAFSRRAPGRLCKRDLRRADHTYRTRPQSVQPGARASVQVVIHQVCRVPLALSSDFCQGALAGD